MNTDAIELSCSWNFMTVGIDNLVAMCAISDFLDHDSGTCNSIKELVSPKLTACSGTWF